MCDVWAERADVWSQEEVRAAKRHTCSGCGLPIVVGCRHLRTGSLLDGEWSTLRTHRECDALAQRIAWDVCSAETYSPACDLREDVREHYHRAPDLLRAWRDILRARRAEGTWPVREVRRG